MRTKIFRFILLVLALSYLTACDKVIDVGGNVSGLTSPGLVLQNNGGDDLAIVGNGEFKFVTPGVPNGTYAVTIKTQPDWSVCTVINGSGTVSSHDATSNQGVVTGTTYDVTNIFVRCVPNGAAPVSLHLLAGSFGVPSNTGSADGAGAEASFYVPRGIAVDSVGNAYVADTGNHTIRKVSAAGMVTTLAGVAGSSGSADGTGAEARFDSPQGIAVDKSGNAYVADTGNHVIRKISAAGVVTTLAGAVGSSGSVDGIGADARFLKPRGVAADSAGNVYVADGSHTIRKISPEGGVTTLAGAAVTDPYCQYALCAESVDGTGAAAKFSEASGVAVDAVGNVYVADTYNQTVRKVSPAGVVTTLAGTAGSLGSADGTGADARFNYPQGITVDITGNVYVADTFNYTVRKISPAGVVTTLAGVAARGGNADGIGMAARFTGPWGIAADGAGNLYVADSWNNTIRKITPAAGVTTIAGRVDGAVDGTGSAARFINPNGIAADSAGNVYVADTGSDTIRKIAPDGVVTTLAGTAGRIGSADGIGTAASFYAPQGIALDGAGNVYVADTGNHVIRKITLAGAVTTLAGVAGSEGSADGIGTAASFRSPAGIAADSSGNVYVADTGNNTVRKISPAGVVTTLAGTASPGSVFDHADGLGAAASFYRPTGIAVDSAGRIYVADNGSHIIRKVSPAGWVTTLAASVKTCYGMELGSANFVSYHCGDGYADGRGADARFTHPSGITVDSAGNIYVADTDNYAIRKITPAGVVSTVIGSASTASPSVQLGALPAFLGPKTVGVAVSADKLFLISDHAVLWAPKL